MTVVYPTSLLEKYRLLKNYRLAPDESLNLQGKTNKYIDDIMDVERGHIEAVQTLWNNEEWDFFFYLFSSTDWISHAMFDELLNNRHAKGMELFKYIDDQLKWFKDNLPEECNLYIMSDHGFKVFSKTFYFNKWLEQEGYLVTQTADSTAFQWRG